MFFCDSLWILNLAPYVIALVLVAMIGLIAVYAWRDLRQRGAREQGAADSTWLLLSLLLLSAIVIVFFSLYVVLSLTGSCNLQEVPIWYTG